MADDLPDYIKNSPLYHPIPAEQPKPEDTSITSRIKNLFYPEPKPQPAPQQTTQQVSPAAYKLPENSPQGEPLSWDRVDPSLTKKVEGFKDSVGYDPVPTSAYRSPQQQAALPTDQKATVSQHSAGEAIDQRVRGLTPDQQDAAVRYYNSDPNFHAVIEQGGTAPHIHVEKVGNQEPSGDIPDYIKNSPLYHPIQPEAEKPKEQGVIDKVVGYLKSPELNKAKEILVKGASQAVEDTKGVAETAARFVNTGIGGILKPVAEAGEQITTLGGLIPRKPGESIADIMEPYVSQPKTKFEERYNQDVTRPMLPYDEASQAEVKKIVHGMGAKPGSLTEKVVTGVADKVLGTAAGFTTPTNAALLFGG